MNYSSYIGGLMPHHDHERNDIGKEHPANHPGQIIGALLFFAVKIAELTFVQWGVLTLNMPAVQIPVAAAILLLAVYMIRAGLKTVFSERRDPPEVIRKGVFNWVRHPVYAGAMLIMVAFIIAIPSLLSVAVLLLNFVFYNMMASYEEGLLVDMFGSEYLNYRKEVGRWLPKLF